MINYIMKIDIISHLKKNLLAILCELILILATFPCPKFYNVISVEIL